MILPPDTWSNPDYHWQPSASQAYTFDLAKANQCSPPPVTLAQERCAPQ